MLPGFFDSIVALIIKTSTDLPPDVRAAMRMAMNEEPEGSRAAQALTIIAQNIDQAADGEGAICQDTGMPTFEVKTPVGANQIWMKQQIQGAVAEATKRGKLRPNSVDSLTGDNSGNNLGPGTPIIHFEQWERDDIEVKLILKGGGCENMNAQYSLPTELPHLGRADRTIEGVRKCILHAVWQAQGKGCAPGAIGVCIGGDRTSGYVHAKEQLFRTLDDVNPDPRLADLEAEIMRTVNTLGVGDDGIRRPRVADRLQGWRAQPAAGELLRFGGVRLLGVPATWRRRSTRDERRDHALAVSRSGGRDDPDDGPGRLPPHRPRGRADDAARRGDGSLAEGRRRRDAQRPRLHRPRRGAPSPRQPRAAGRSAGRRDLPLRPGRGERAATAGSVTAAGPTTSIREEPYQGDIIRKYGVRAVIGKGGMGAKTLAALKEAGAVYLNAIGGAAQFYARCIERVDGVSLLEFGTPEAMWHLQLRDFPAIVTMDAHGNSLHQDHRERVGRAAGNPGRCKVLADP